MAYCVKCGTMVGDDVKFCPQCGEEIPKTDSQRSGQTYYSQAEPYNTAGAYDTSSSGTYGSSGTYSSAGAYSSAGSYDSSGEYGTSGFTDKEGYFNPGEVKRNRAMGVLSYLGILVLIPLLAGDKSSEYVRHHANQGLVLFLVSTVVDLLDGSWVWGFHSLIHMGGAGFSLLLNIADFACLIMMIMGIVSACKGKRTELPLIGKIKFWR